MNGLAPRYIINATFSCFLRHTEDILQFWVYKTKANNNQLGRFPFSQNFRFNRLKCKWYAGFQRKFSGTDGQPSELLHFFRCNRSERKHSVPLHDHRKTNTCFSGGIDGLPKGFPKGILPVFITSLVNNSAVVRVILKCAANSSPK